jgi:hypothetical protein
VKKLCLEVSVFSLADIFCPLRVNPGLLKHMVCIHMARACREE